MHYEIYAQADSNKIVTLCDTVRTMTARTGNIYEQATYAYYG